ncbi:tetraketide alpha-pyrone reductase 1 [Amborella trichopoda]|uniref:NAD-dependent epimerase/dehydratase domain-containing protein n=1 Tax=Amborella trichopoda TaxID=13333 RepID=W1PUQ2_AMBTC|nr:tetraketide alpha-pyrone reductase 1 [Amborella trichopoda]ERN11436.1 hypothetical protein AMTR_s00022p00057010 [Amborella trichopoda]|eukprot:XP_006849855.1 tetraketide alpha-pyrone reductase 1 [Amborella trichopoda]
MELPKGKVCVTGASGYLASWLVKKLLLLGYNVIGTVRDPGNYKKVGHLLELESAKERLQLVKADLLEEGSFDQAFDGCHGVFHVASPIVVADLDLKTEILDPAVNGTLNVLRCCKRNPSIKRVVLTSSTAAVRARDDFDPSIPLDESSWSSVQLCQKLKVWYALSKTLAERAAWKFAEENGIDLVTVLPSFIIGPSLPRDLSATASNVLALLKGDSPISLRDGRMGYVHIDDVACCHVLVYEDAKAKGRYLCSSTILENYELTSFLKERYPNLTISSFGKHPRPYYELNTFKLENLGFTFRSIEEMFDDCVESLKEQGYL